MTPTRLAVVCLKPHMRVTTGALTWTVWTVWLDMEAAADHECSISVLISRDAPVKRVQHRRKEDSAAFGFHSLVFCHVCSHDTATSQSSLMGTPHNEGVRITHVFPVCRVINRAI
jgi:hypothetical protein